MEGKKGMLDAATNYLAVIKVVGIGGGGNQRREPHDQLRFAGG